MIYRKQLYFHDPDNGVWGDCHRTAIACLLDKEPEEVPNFAELSRFNGEDFHDLCKKYLASQGLATFDIIFNCALEDMMKTMEWYNDNVLWLLGGKSGNGTDHTVICQGGKIIWDPARDDSGITGPIDGLYWVTILIPISMTNQDETLRELAESRK